jgi:hypothetical protein
VTILYSIYVLFSDLTSCLSILSVSTGQKVVTSNASALKLAAIIVTNTIYELALMFMLAYALVEFPRSLWNKSYLDYYLLKIQQKAASEFKEIQEHQLSVSLVVSDVLKTKAQVGRSFNILALVGLSLNLMCLV